MGRPGLLAVVLVALAACAGCSGETISAADGTVPEADAGSDVSGEQDAAADAGGVQDSGEAHDAEPSEFCSGNSKAAHGVSLSSPATVTSMMLAMDCCDGFTLRFHTAEELGFDLSARFIQMGGLMPGGTYVFPSDAGLSVKVSVPAEPLSEGWEASGTLVYETTGAYDQPSHATACLSVTAPGASVDGARMFAAHVPIAPWAWASRLEFRLLADPDISAVQAAEQPLESLTLASVASFDLLAIDWYEAATHTVHWGDWHNSTAVKNQLPKVGVGGLPFVVVADGQRAYLGAFMTMLSSYAIDLPVIVLESMQQDSFVIERGYPGGPVPAEDPRNDTRVMGVLEAAAKLEK